LRTIVRVCKVHAQTGFIPIAAKKISRINRLIGALYKRRAPAARIVAQRVFNFKHVSAHIRQGLAGKRPSQNAGQINHTQTIECASHKNLAKNRKNTPQTVRLAQYGRANFVMMQRLF
jgi:hypothetical protein